jgi:hypothetical protein
VLALTQDAYFQRFVDVTERAGAEGKRQLAENLTLMQQPGESADALVNRLWHTMRVADQGGVYPFAATSSLATTE